MGQLAIMSREEGHSTVLWDEKTNESVEEARRIFDEMVNSGHLAFRVDEHDHAKDEVIRRFDPDAELIVMSPAIAGG